MPDQQRILDIIANTDSPRTRESIATGLRKLGLAAGDTVIVHSSLSSLGFVSGGAPAVVQALIDVITDSGTIVMPTHSSDYSDPAGWEAPPVPQSWVEPLRASLPAFDPEVTPTSYMGQIVEVFRRWPGNERSRHPTISFAAWGPDSEFVTEGHTYEEEAGDGSPLGRVYDLDGKVLLLGVGYDRNTSFHLAEYRVPGYPRRKRLLPTPERGRSVWREFDDTDEMSQEWLLELGGAFESARDVTVGTVGSAEARLFSQRHAVDFAIGWLKEKHRGSAT